MMNIVVLDGHTLNPGDLSWEPLQRLGHLTVYDRTPPEAVIERSREASLLLTNKVVLSAELIQQLPDLKYIGVMATGTNVVDGRAAATRGIPVTNVENYSSAAVAQHTFALLLALSNDIPQLTASTRNGDWARQSDFCYWFKPLPELAGKTLGLVGFGNIARQVARRAKAFGMQVMVHRQSDKPLPRGFEQATLERLFRESDVVSLHCPLTDDTRGMVDAALLKTMKASAYLINTARGPLIVETDLAAALQAGVLAGAGLDVLTQEPPTDDNALFSAPNCLITPHLSWWAIEARQRLLHEVARNIRAFQRGRSRRVVNGVGA